MRLVFHLVLCLIFTLVLAESELSEPGNDLNSDPDFSNDDADVPSSNGITRFISGLFQIPVTMFRAFNSFISSAPFSRLRDEMRSLNISYPKS